MLHSYNPFPANFGDDATMPTGYTDGDGSSRAALPKAPAHYRKQAVGALRLWSFRSDLSNRTSSQPHRCASTTTDEHLIWNNVQRMLTSL